MVLEGRAVAQSAVSGNSRRRANVLGAYRAVENRAREKKILIVDDVFTTGSTTAECFRVLAEAFPDARISVATLAFVE